jgi:hypothetical protein
MSTPTPQRFLPPVLGRLVRATIAAGVVWLVLAPSPAAATGAVVVDLAVSAPMVLSAHGDALVAAPSVAEAIAAGSPGARSPAARSPGAPAAVVPDSGFPVRGSLVVAQAASLDQVLTNIRNLILGLAGGAALVCWSVAGLRMMFSQGEPGEVAKARSAFRAGAVGFAVVILAPLALAVLRMVVGL